MLNSGQKAQLASALHPDGMTWTMSQGSSECQQPLPAIAYVAITSEHPNEHPNEANWDTLQLGHVS